VEGCLQIEDIPLECVFNCLGIPDPWRAVPLRSACTVHETVASSWAQGQYVVTVEFFLIFRRKSTSPALILICTAVGFYLKERREKVKD